MIKWLEIKNTFRNKRFILFTLIFPAFWYLFMISFSKEFGLYGQTMKYILFLTAAIIGISGNSIVTFSKKISTTRRFYQLQQQTSHYSFRRWLGDQLFIQLILNSIICVTLMVLGTIFSFIPFTTEFLILLCWILILGMYLTVIGFLIGLLLDGDTISALAMPLSTGFSALMFPWTAYVSGHNWFLESIFFIQKFFPGYYIAEYVQESQHGQHTGLTILFFILTTLVILIPAGVVLMKKHTKQS